MRKTADHKRSTGRTEEAETGVDSDAPTSVTPLNDSVACLICTVP